MLLHSFVPLALFALVILLCLSTSLLQWGQIFPDCWDQNMDQTMDQNHGVSSSAMDSHGFVGSQGLAIMQLPLFVLAALPVRWFVGRNLNFGLCTLALETDRKWRVDQDRTDQDG